MRISDWSSDVCSSDLLDLGRADAVARSLDHRVVAADEKEQAIGISADGVARPDRRAAVARGGGRGLETLRGALGIPQIGRASWRERVCQYVLLSVVAVPLKTKNNKKRRYTTNA